MKRILLLSNIFPSQDNPIGGTFVRSRIATMRSMGIEVDPVAVGPRVARRPLGVEEHGFIDATVHAWSGHRGYMRFRVRSAKLEDRAAARVRAAIDLRDYDGIMAHGLYALGAGYVARRLASDADLPFTVHLHGSDVNQVMRRNPNAARRLLHDADGAVFVSAALRRTAMAMGYDGVNSVVTGNGVDLDLFKPARSHGSGTDQCVLFVANLLQVKGADRVPSIFRALRSQGTQSRLVVVGDGPLRGKLERELRGLPVTFYGRVLPQRVAEIMAAADVVILPSRSEGWPTVINESYASGTPVVAADVGGVREALIDDYWAVEPGPKFVERFATLVGEAMESTRGDALRSHAERFGWRSIVEREMAAMRKDR